MNPLSRHCFFSTLWGSSFSTLFFFSLFGGLQVLGGISSFLSSNYLSNAARIISGDPLLTRVMTIFIKTYIFVKVREGRKERKKEERKDGRKEGRKERMRLYGTYPKF